MTTNYREKLDPALYRIVRCDNRIYFGMAIKSVAQEMFSRISEPAVQSNHQSGHGNDAGTQSNTLELREIDQFAAQFAKKILELGFSPADVLSYLRSEKGGGNGGNVDGASPRRIEAT